MGWARRTGFTLVEVMVTISIIIVLALVVFVMTRRIQASALQAKALNSMRQVSVGNTGYAMENNGDINVLLDSGDPRQTNGYIRKNFWGLLAPYLFTDVPLADNNVSGQLLRQQMESLLSTSNSKFMTGTFQQGPQAYGDRSGLAVPFAFSLNVYNWGKYLKTSQYSDPAQVLYMSFGFYRFNAEDGEKYVPVPKTKAERQSNIDFFPNRTAAFTFLDGHVEILSTPIPKHRFGEKPPVN
jgi:prepilin-type N-terminal cleavage/methylation domain-containing protein/prepilin-type processing-associated H-X9-DG protein